MATGKIIKNRLSLLKREYDLLRLGKESLLNLIDEADVSESVYNSNAIENSTLTLKETEKILLDMEVSRNVSLREVFEAKNLARVISYIRNKDQKTELNRDTVLLLHRMLIGGIADEIAGRFRAPGEYVRVGTYIAPAPENIDRMFDSLLSAYQSDLESYFLDKVARFHLDFENLHPFNDGNGRIGRVLICFQLRQQDFPMIIIRDKEKKKYYQAFADYRYKRDTKTMEKIIGIALIESLNKRISYLKGQQIVSLADYCRQHKLSAAAMINAARRQNIPAFREKGIWKIGGDFRYEPRKN